METYKIEIQYAETQLGVPSQHRWETRTCDRGTTEAQAIAAARRLARELPGVCNCSVHDHIGRMIWNFANEGLSAKTR